jgi:hypothetical protein
VNDLPGAFAADDALPPELLGPPEPPPPTMPRSSAVLRMLVRVVLWSLIAVGALRGLVPPMEAGPDRASAVTVASDRGAEAVAAAFLREYLTVGGDRAARVERLRRFTVSGVDLHQSVSVPAGVAQYVDQVAVSAVRPVDAGTEVTMLVHVLQVRSGIYRDGGTLAFVVPLAVGQEGAAVSGPPRPAALPVDPRLVPQRPRATAPAGLVRAAKRAARQAVVALVRTDVDALAHLGGDRPPLTRTLPSGWRATSVGGAEVAGRSGSLTARVQVRARPPAGEASYLIPVRVRLQPSAQGVLVRHVDAGGSA